MRASSGLLFAGLATALLIAAAPAHGAFPGKNGKIAFSRVDPSHAAPRIYTMSSDGTNQVSLGVTGTDPAWSADGSKLAFRSDDGIATVNADGTGLAQLTLAQDYQPTWSPDGTRIAFARYADGYRLYVMNADGSDATLLAADPKDDMYPSWSPDGSKIVFNSSRSGGVLNADVYTVDADGSNPTPVNEHPAYDVDPSWSPDGSRIVFASLRDPGHSANSFDLFTMSAGGSGVVRLTQNDQDDIEPAWSPDGSKIVFAARGQFFPLQGYNIYTMNTDGSGRVNLTTSGFDSAPDWQPIPGPRRSDYKNAAKFCKAEQDFWGAAFEQRYGGGANAYGRCVSTSK